MRAGFWLGLALLVLSVGQATAANDADADSSDYGRTGIPIFGYDDKSGWLFGGAGFLYSDHEPGVNAGLFFVSNLHDFNSVTFNYDERSKGPLSYSLHFLGERAFDHYYGEGDLTPAEDLVVLHMDHFEIRPGVLYRVMPHLRMGAFAELRSRYEDTTQVFPNEGTSVWGLQAQWDTRDKLINTRSGDLFLLNLSRMPYSGAFSQADVDLRHFKRLDRHWTWGQRLVAGASMGGVPTYLFRYHLGGLDLLRGYKNNRFRGSEFWVVQQELRWILIKWLSVNGSIDLGGIRDDAYHQLKASAQIGLRLGLPPDWGQKMRVDLGFGADQMTFQIQFGEIF